MSGIDILSPHYDDAVLSAWYQIEQPGSNVITIFGGVPEVTKTGIWDAFSTRSDSTKTVNLRRAENAGALEGTPSTAINLDFPDRQYSPLAKRNIPEITSTVEAISTQSILAPVGVGTYLRNHPDHIATRKVALELLQLGHDVSFYADIPYLLPIWHLHNWPIHLPIGKIERVLGSSVDIETIELDYDAQKRKQEAFRKFSSQTAMVNKLAFGALKSSAAFRFEAIIRPV